MRGVLFLGKSCSIRQGAEYRHACDALALLGAVVVQEAGDPPAAMLNAGQDHAAGITSAQNQGAAHLAVAVAQAGEHLLVERAVNQPHQGQPHEHKQGMQGQHGARDFGELQHQNHGGSDQASDQAGKSQALQLAKATEAPDAFGNPQQPEHPNI